MLKKAVLSREKNKIALNFISGCNFSLYPTKILEKLKNLKKEGFYNIIFYNPSFSYDNYRLIDDKTYVPYVLELEKKAILLPFDPYEFKKSLN